jgi:exopolysaccharide biosynthesis protein
MIKRSGVKKIVSILLTTVFIVNLNTYVAHAQYTYYEKSEVESLGKGITYTKSQQVTERGLLDVYILKAPLNDPYIKIKPATSAVQFELKESTTKILGDNGAIAGINGDFFNMQGTHSATIGQVVKDGVVISADALNNIDKNAYASFLIDVNNNPFIDYVNTEIHFLNNGAEYIKVMEYNKMSNMVYSGYIDRNAMKDTTMVDNKFKNVTKVVVENGYVTYISGKGEIVNVPENGFVILISDEGAEYFTSVINVGERAEIKVTGSVDYSMLQTAIGGSGKILTNGQLSNDDGFIPSGNQPRTAIGFNKDGTEVTLMVVDGRTHSVGATKADMANILIKNGVYEALNLDGGGSTTMGVKKINDDYVKSVNTLSEGTQRKVANVIGIFNDSPVGNLSDLHFKTDSYYVFENTVVPLNVIGVDSYNNEVALPVDAEIKNTLLLGSGLIDNRNFTPTSTGEIEIISTYNEFATTKKMFSLQLAQLKPKTKTIETGVGAREELVFMGTSKNGEEVLMYGGINYELYPNDLGYIQDNVFTSNKIGSGYIKAFIGDIVTYIAVNVGAETRQLTSFENDIAFSTEAYPSIGLSKAAYGNQIVQDKSYSLELAYRFDESVDTQAAYIILDTPVFLKENASKINLFVKGDGSGNWLRTKLVDATGKEVLLDLSNSINFTEWKEVSAKVPEGLVYPVRIERIYVASIGNTNTNVNSIYIDNLSVEERIYFEKITLPIETTFVDPLKVTLSEQIGSGFDITVLGDITEQGNIVQDVVNRAKSNSSRVIFAGEAPNIGDIGVKMYKWNTTYMNHDHENVQIIQMSAKNGGLIDTNIEQWGKFTNDIIQGGKDHVIIMIDKNPFNFKNAKENELFQYALEDLAKLGKSIFIVSTEGTTTTNSLKNGVRYINLGGLFKEAKLINEKFQILRFRVDGTTIKFNLENAV